MTIRVFYLSVTQVHFEIFCKSAHFWNSWNFEFRAGSGLETISVLGQFSNSVKPLVIRTLIQSWKKKLFWKNFFTLFFEATFNACGFSVLKIFMNFRISRERRELSRGHVANISQWDGSRNIGRQLKMGWKRLFDLILAHYWRICSPLHFCIYFHAYAL